MSNESSLSPAELSDRIRILEDNIRQLIEQAAAASGEQNESRIADRLSQQNEEPVSYTHLTLPTNREV